MDVLVNKILEVARDAGKPRPAGAKGTVSLVAPDESAAPAEKQDNLFANFRLDQCCTT